MLPDRVSNPGPLTYESGALPTQIITVQSSSSSDNIAKSRIELKGKFLPIPTNKIYMYYHFILQLGTFMIYFSLFHKEIRKTVAGLLGGPKGMLAKLLGASPLVPLFLRL